MGNIHSFKTSCDYHEDISHRQNLSEDFIRKFQADWIDRFIGVVFQYRQNLSEDFIREFQDKVDWYYISHFQNLSEDFIREFQDKVDWELSKFIRRYLSR